MTRMKLFNLIQIAIIIAGFVAAFLLVTNPAEARVNGECERWAYNLGEDNYPDSIIMHTIGCDNSGETFAPYVRDEGRCAAIARAAFRNRGLPAASLALDNYMMTRGCDTLDDGTYHDLRASRS
jgi:hypothetical protein